MLWTVPRTASGSAPIASPKLSAFMGFSAHFGCFGVAFTGVAAFFAYRATHWAKAAAHAARQSAAADNEALAETRAAADEARKSSAAGEEANRISREALVADQRPWISITNVSLAGPITFHPQNGWRIDLVFKFKNVGRSPALNVIPSIKVLVPQNRNLPEVHRLFAEETRANAHRHFGQTVFPGQPGEQGVSTDITIDEFNAAMDFPNDSKLIHPTIIGVIAYQTMGGLTHLTGFNLLINTADGRALTVPKNPPDGYSVGGIQLMRSLMGWFAD
ncbi:MAG: hypothetical protein KKC14_13745 [Alphaproteobacteria bacterium]|nr:hypothetical protein [Alphaproteobacteria bacterium]